MTFHYPADLPRHLAPLNIRLLSSRATLPDAAGHFGPYGGIFVPETLVAAIEQLSAEYEKAKNDPEFQEEFEYYLREFVGRPSLLYHCPATLPMM